MKRAICIRGLDGRMSVTNMLTTYSWAASLFQQELPSSLIDVEKRARLVNEINAPLMQGNSSNTD